MNLKRLLYTDMGKVFISILLGLGLATLFRKVCKDKNCIQFNGPVLSEIDGKAFKHGDGCFKYMRTPVKCDTSKQIIDIATPDADHTGSPPSGHATALTGSSSGAAPADSGVFGKWFS